MLNIEKSRLAGKKILIVLLSVASFQAVNAQGKLNEAKLAIGTQQWEKAKNAIDAYLSDQKNAATAEGWYYKGAIYNMLSKDPATSKLCADCRTDAFAAFKKYQELDPANKEMAPSENVDLFDLYNTYFDDGARNYNAGNKAGYDSAFYLFKMANEVGKYLYGKKISYKGFSFPALDTSLVQNIGLAAFNGGSKDEAAIWFKQITDADVSSPNYRDIYQSLAEYYADKKDAAALSALVVKASKLYPDYEYWSEIELEMVDKTNKPALFAKYDELLKTNTGKYTMHYNYAVEMFNYLYVGDSKPADAEARTARFFEVIKQAIALNNTPDANLLAARSLYNQTYDLQDAMRAIKGPKPEDNKKRQDIKAASLKKADECIVYGEKTVALYKAMETLKGGQKANYKNALSIVESMYGYKGNTAKAEEYKKLSETIH